MRLLHRELDVVRSILQAHPELEYDEQGNLVGSGLTLLPTVHQLQVEQRTLFAWCAFDTLTYPVALHLSAQVTSRCPVTGRSIHLTVTPEQVLDLDPAEAQVSLSVTPTGIHELTLADAVVSIVIPGQGSSCNGDRGSFCNQSRFFRSKRDALMWQGAHPDARILCVEDAYRLGKLVARYRHEDTTEHERT